MKPKMKTKVLAVDISLNETTYAIVDIRGNIVAKDHFRTRDYPHISNFLEHLATSLVSLAEKHCGLMEIRSIGVGAPSGNFTTGCINNSPNMPWKGVIPLAAMLRDRTGLACAVGNNCHSQALGEEAYGNAHGMKNFSVVSIGHGLGCCTFTNGKINLGSDGYAGELGHTCVVDNGRECGCGLQGCLEAYVAEKGILATVKDILEETDEPSVLRSFEFKDLTPEDVTKCCDHGDKLAQEVYRRAGYLLGISLANHAAICNPEAIILVGGITNAGKWLLDPCEQSFNQHLFHNIRGTVRVLCSGIKDRERDILGASVLAWQVKEYSLFR